MAEVKIPQEIGTEDKIIGPLTLKQFLKLALGSGIIYLGFVWSQSLGLPLFVFLILATPLGIFFALLVFFKVNEQPFEKYLLAVFNYYTTPQKRVWKRMPKKELPVLEAKKKEAQVVVPKKVTRSRIEELAYILDTKGYVEKEKKEASVIEEMKRSLIEKRSGEEEETYYKGLSELLPPSVIIPEKLKEEAEIALKEVPKAPAHPKSQKVSKPKVATALPPSPPQEKEVLEVHLPMPPKIKKEAPQETEVKTEASQEKPPLIINLPRPEEKKPFLKKVIITMQEHLKELSKK